jgi:hypothetical protein
MENHRVNPDNAPGGVCQSASRIAWRETHVGLNPVATCGMNHPSRDGAGNTQRISNRQHDLPAAQQCGIADLSRFKSFPRNLEQRQIALGIVLRDARGSSPAPGIDDAHVTTSYNVSIRHNHALPAPNNARSSAAPVQNLHRATAQSFDYLFVAWHLHLSRAGRSAGTIPIFMRDPPRRTSAETVLPICSAPR